MMADLAAPLQRRRMRAIDDDDNATFFNGSRSPAMHLPLMRMRYRHELLAASKICLDDRHI